MGLNSICGRVYDKLLLCFTAIAYISVQISAADPLDPSFVGETMSTGMDLELVQQAKDAGIIKPNNPMYNSVSKTTPLYLGTPPGGAETNTPAAADMAEVENANVTGPWSLDLSGELTKHIDLSITQNKDDVMGYGTIAGGNGTQRVTASGSFSGGRIILTVMPTNSLDLYKLDLSLDPHTTGTYTASSASGDTRSGDITGIAPSGVSEAASNAINPNLSKSLGADTQSLIRAGAASSVANSSSSASSVVHLGSGSASPGQGYSASASSSNSISMSSSGGLGGGQYVSSISSGSM